MQILKDAKFTSPFPTFLDSTPELVITEHLVYTSKHKGAKNIVLPVNSTYDFNNPLVAIEQRKNVNKGQEFNFILQNGESTNLQFKNKKSKTKEVVRIDPPDS